MSNRVLVLDTNKVPLMPCHPARARELLSEGKAAVYRRYPFTIILRDRLGGDTQPIDIKIDPGTRFTGVALVGWFKRGPRCIYGLHIKHRGVSVRQAMESRAELRRSRRSRKLRYRQPRFNNRTRPSGWVPPSIESRVSNVMTWVRRLLSTTPASQVYFEVVKFDTDAMANVTRDQYDTDARIRTQMRHYLLTTRGNICSYCKGVSADTRLEREHVIPRSRGGTDALTNAELACRRCNLDKGTMLLGEWLNVLKGRKDPLSVARLKHIPKCVRRIRHSLRDASIMNWARYIIVRRMREDRKSVV